MTCLAGILVDISHPFDLQGIISLYAFCGPETENLNL